MDALDHLLQDRFKSEPCNDSGYFVVLMRYIHQNPVKAALQKQPGNTAIVHGGMTTWAWVTFMFA